MNIRYVGLILCLANAITFAQPNFNWVKLFRDKTISEEQKIEQFRQAMATGFDVNTKTQDYIQKFTPLMLASEIGAINVVKFLVENKARINEVDANGVSALFYAAAKGHLDIVKLLLSHGADIKHIAKTTKPGQITQVGGNNVLLYALSKYGANLEEAEKNNRKDQFKNNFLATASLLINNGIDVNAKGAPSEGAKTAIMWAAQWNAWDLVKLFEYLNADLYVKDQFGAALLQYLPDLNNPAHIRGLTDIDKRYIKDLHNEILQGGWTEI